MNARSPTEAGFTIVETMIFLAISGLMFVLAINAMGGKQQQTEFNTGVDTLKAQLNEDLSGVGDGNYLSLGTDTCTTLVSPPDPSLITTPGVAPDGSCTVIGEVIAFNNDVASNTKQSYTVFPAIGRNYLSDPGGSDPDQVVTDLTDALPQISTLDDRTVTMPYGLTLSQNPVISTTISGSGYGAFGVFSFTSFEGNNAGNSPQTLSSGSSHVEIFSLPTTTVSDSPTTTVANINAGLGNSSVPGGYIFVNNDIGPDRAPINPTAGITFCVNSGTNSESALFTIGGNNSPSSATDQVYDKPDCMD